MALTPSRWIMFAVLGFVLAPVLVFSRSERLEYRWTERERLQTRASRAQSRMRAAAERIRTERLADSVRRSFPVASGTLRRISFDRALDSTPRRLLGDVARRATVDRPASPRIGSDIAFVVDSVQMIDGVQRRGFSGALSLNYVVPARGGTERCVVIARVKPWGVNEFTSEASRERLLGPCAFYESFGAPGAGIERWLMSGGWSFAQNASEADAGRWPWSTRDDYPLRYILGGRGVSCAKGNRPACLDALEHPSMNGWQLRAGLLTTEFNPYIMTGGWYSRDWSFGPRAPSLLADMAADLGPDRFTRFWQSDLEPATAFRAASGTELSDWARQWVVRTYHEEEAGPGVSGEAWAWGLAVLALSLGVILRSSERRQMS